jgi:hypothetical protein
MSGPVTMTPAPAEDDSIFSDREFTILIVSALVQRLGGTVTLTQGDLDRVAFGTLGEHQSGSALRLEVRHTQGGTA